MRKWYKFSVVFITGTDQQIQQAQNMIREKIGDSGNSGGGGGSIVGHEYKKMVKVKMCSVTTTVTEGVQADLVYKPTPDFDERKSYFLLSYKPTQSFSNVVYCIIIYKSVICEWYCNQINKQSNSYCYSFLHILET